MSDSCGIFLYIMLSIALLFIGIIWGSTIENEYLNKKWEVQVVEHGYGEWVSKDGRRVFQFKDKK